MTNQYEEQANKFLADTGTTFKIEYLRTGPYFHGDKESRDIYRFALSNTRGSYSSEFGDSIRNTEDRLAAKRPFSDKYMMIEREKKAHDAAVKRHKAHPHPTAYDVLAGMGYYTSPIFEEWVSDCGYDDAPMADYPKIRAVHEACVRESVALERMFTPDQMEQLAEIN